jgi:hypothetical protein
MAWVAHVQGAIAISSVQGEETAAEKLFHRQLKYVTVSLEVLTSRNRWQIMLTMPLALRRCWKAKSTLSI